MFTVVFAFGVVQEKAFQSIIPVDCTGQRVLLANLCIYTPTGLAPGFYFYRINNQDQVFKKGKWVKL